MGCLHGFPVSGFAPGTAVKRPWKDPFFFAFEKCPWLDAGMDGAANRVEVRRLAVETHALWAWILKGEGGSASAKSRFDPPWLAAGSFIFWITRIMRGVGQIS